MGVGDKNARATKRCLLQPLLLSYSSYNLVIMGYEHLHDLFVLLGFLGVPTVIGSIALGARYLGILKQRDKNELELKKLELEISARNADLREKEADIETKRLAFDIQALEQKYNQQKKLS
jgi:hypothetical protein